MNRALCRAGFFDAYVDALADGKPRWIERSIAHGLIGDLLGQVEQRKRKDFLNWHTIKDGKRRRLVIDGERLLALTNGERERLLEWFERFAAKQADPKFHRPLDAAHRHRGHGQPLPATLCNARSRQGFAVCLCLSGSISRRRIRCRQDSAQAAACLAGCGHAHRYRAEARAGNCAGLPDASEFFRSGVRVEGTTTAAGSARSVRRAGKVKPLNAVIQSMGQLVAWSALRGSGRCRAAACADDLIAFAKAIVLPLDAHADRIRRRLQTPKVLIADLARISQSVASHAE